MPAHLSNATVAALQHQALSALVRAAAASCGARAAWLIAHEPDGPRLVAWEGPQPEVRASRVRNPAGAEHVLASVTVQDEGVLVVADARDRTLDESQLALLAQLAASAGPQLALVRHERAASEAHALLETLVRALPIGIVIAEAPTGRVLLASDELRRLLPLSAEGEPAVDCRRPEGARTTSSDWPLVRALRHGETVTREVILADAGRVLEVSAAPVRGPTGEPIAAVCAVVDVTERERADELREHVIGMVGHDLRDPLNAIVLAVGLLQRSALGPRETRTVERIRASGEHMARIIRNTLEFVRARRGLLSLDREEVDLAAETTSIARQLEVAFPGRLELQIQGACTGRFDRGRVGQVVQNLLGNALKHGASDQPVSVLCDGTASNAVVLRVHNRGAPIAADLLPHVFEPFKHGPGRIGREGSLGLGLFIVDQIVRAHGGVVEARSNEQDGTTFTVTLPR